MFWLSVKSQLKIKSETLSSMAKSLELNYRTIQNQISRGISPDIETAVKIAQYLNTSVEFLVTGQEQNQYKERYEHLALLVNELASTIKT